MVFRNDIEGVFPHAYYRFINAQRLTVLCDGFHIVSNNELDTIRKETRDGNLVTTARLKTEMGETIFYTAHTTYSDLQELRPDEVAVAA